MTTPELARMLRASSVAVRGSDRGGGSGVIWSSDGWVVTNAHVARSRDSLVALADGREYRGTLVSGDRERDLALLKIDAAGLTAAQVGDSDQLRAGELVAAIGNPLGISGALTMGVAHAAGNGPWIQASVRLAPGNSGGMLADARGRVVGINTMIQSGLALAIPSRVVVAFVRQALGLEGARAA